MKRYLILALAFIPAAAPATTIQLFDDPELITYTVLPDGRVSFAKEGEYEGGKYQRPLASIRPRARPCTPLPECWDQPGLLAGMWPAGGAYSTAAGNRTVAQLAAASGGQAVVSAVGGSGSWFGPDTEFDYEDDDTDHEPPAPIPLPAAGWLLLAGLVGFWRFRK